MAEPLAKKRHDRGFDSRLGLVTSNVSSHKLDLSTPI
jgi:hypothetical protein